MDNQKFEKLVDNLSNEDLWLFFAFLERKLKEKGLVRSRNIVGERGEFLAIETYNKIPGLPKLMSWGMGMQTQKKKYGGYSSKRRAII